MTFLLYLGIALFAGGLVLAHVALFTSRKPVREGKKVPRKHVVLTWLAVGMAVVGLGLAGVPMLLGH